MLEVSEREEGVVTLHQPIWPLKTCWSRYRDTNSVPTSPLSDDIPTAPSGMETNELNTWLIYIFLFFYW